LDTFGVLVQIIEGDAVGNCLGVEEDEIGGVALDDRAAVRKTKWCQRTRRSRRLG
jgi:hypothetical protein